MRVALPILLILTVAGAYALGRLGGLRGGSAGSGGESGLSSLASFRDALEQPDALERFSRRSEGFSIARLRAIGSEAARRAGRSGRVDFALLQASLRAVQGTRRRLAESTPGLEDLVLDPQLRQTLRGLASRMRDVERIERLGGTVPQGALFFGPPGTGKTAAVRALAKDSGWVLIPTHGAELSADAKAIDRIIAEARDLRPSIVFIDEADAIVGHRMGSHLQSVTNAILIAMDARVISPSSSVAPSAPYAFAAPLVSPSSNPSIPDTASPAVSFMAAHAISPA